MEVCVRPYSASCGAKWASLNSVKSKLQWSILGCLLLLAWALSSIEPTIDNGTEEKHEHWLSLQAHLRAWGHAQAKPCGVLTTHAAGAHSGNPPVTRTALAHSHGGVHRAVRLTRILAQIGAPAAGVDLGLPSLGTYKIQSVHHNPDHPGTYTVNVFHELATPGTTYSDDRSTACFDLAKVVGVPVLRNAQQRARSYGHHSFYTSYSKLCCSNACGFCYISSTG
jgi:hypothetical protein